MGTEKKELQERQCIYDLGHELDGLSLDGAIAYLTKVGLDNPCASSFLFENMVDEECQLELSCFEDPEEVKQSEGYAAWQKAKEIYESGLNQFKEIK